MEINLKNYSKLLDIIYTLYKKQRNRLNAFNQTLHTFDDGEKIEWTQAQKQKKLNEAQADVTTMKNIVSELEIAIGLVEAPETPEEPT